jgi:hypothetical protein
MSRPASQPPSVSPLTARRGALPPLPPGVSYVCRRCGDATESVGSKAWCPTCFLVFTPPRLPSWVVQALWEGYKGEASPNEGCGVGVAVSGGGAQ